MSELRDQQVSDRQMTLNDAFETVYPRPKPAPRRVGVRNLPPVALTIVVALPLFIALTYKYWLPSELLLFGCVAVIASIGSIYHIARRWSLYRRGLVARGYVTSVERIGKSAVRISYQFNAGGRSYSGGYFGIRHTAPAVSASVWLVHDQYDPSQNVIVPNSY